MMQSHFRISTTVHLHCRRISAHLSPKTTANSAPRFFNFDSIWSRALCSLWDSAWHQSEFFDTPVVAAGYTWIYLDICKTCFASWCSSTFFMANWVLVEGASCFHSLKFQRSVLVFMKIKGGTNHLLWFVTQMLEMFTLQETNISPQKWHFEDDFPFPKVGYVHPLEGILIPSDS